MTRRRSVKQITGPVTLFHFIYAGKAPSGVRKRDEASEVSLFKSDVVVVVSIMAKMFQSILHKLNLY